MWRLDHAPFCRHIGVLLQYARICTLHLSLSLLFEMCAW